MTSPYRTLSRPMLAALYEAARDFKPTTPDEETVDVTAKLTKKSTEKAILVIVENAEIWIPRSQIRGMHPISKRVREIEVTLWWAKQAIPWYLE